MIPKIIHQVWIGPLEPPTEWINTWRQAHPDWEHHLWTESDFDFPLTCLRQVLLSPTFAGKVDILSYEILQRYGGIYLDADSVCLRPIDGKLLEKDFLIAYENEVARPGLIAHGIMGCKPGHAVINELVDSISMLTPAQMSGYDFVVTGPELITRVIKNHKHVEVMPSHLFYPYHFTGERCSDDQLSKAYAVQVWGSTDHDSDIILSVRKKYGYRQQAYCGSRIAGQMPAILNAAVKQNRKFSLQQQEEGYFLTGDSNYWVHQLNETSAITWELCNEGCTVQEIIDLLSSEHPADVDVIQRDIYDVICEFIKMDFVELSWQTQ